MQVAKALKPCVEGLTALTTNNCEDFCLFLRDKCGVPYMTSKVMLSNLLPLKINAFNMFRLALAIMHYLPNFEGRDVSLKDLQEDLPNLWVHVRITDVDVREEAPGHFYAYLEVLCMTSLLAGRLMNFRVPYYQLKKVFCALGLRTRVKESETVIPRELCSMYGHIHLGDTVNQARTILAWSATASEKKKNKELVQLRKRKDCSFPDIVCTDCKMGKDRCALACRKVTINDQ